MTRMHFEDKPVLSREEYQQKLAELEPQRCEPKSFEEPEPTLEEARTELEAEAKDTVRGPSFMLEWLQKRYVDKNLERRYNIRMSEWWFRGQDFDKEARLAAAEENVRLYDEYLAQKDLMEKALVAGKEEIEAVSQDLLQECCRTGEIARIETPVEFLPETATLIVDVDLGSANFKPTELAFYERRKTAAKQLRTEYFGSVVSLAASLFGRSPNIDEIVISSYTERRDKIGNVYDEYVLSVEFKRIGFVDTEYWLEDPKEFCEKFTHRFKFSQFDGFKKIDPFVAKLHRDPENSISSAVSVPRFDNHLTIGETPSKEKEHIWGLNLSSLRTCIQTNAKKIGATYEELEDRVFNPPIPEKCRRDGTYYLQKKIRETRERPHYSDDEIAKRIVFDIYTHYCSGFGPHWLAAEVQPKEMYEQKLAMLEPQRCEPEPIEDLPYSQLYAFDKEVLLAEAEENIRLYDEYSAEKAKLEQLLDNSKVAVESFVRDTLLCCVLPWRVDAEFEFRPETGTLMLDLLLPEEPDISNSKRLGYPYDHGWKKYLGKTSSAEYSGGSWGYLFGLTIFLASQLFAAKPCIERIVLSSRAKRFEIMDGDFWSGKYSSTMSCSHELIFDGYVISIRFNRAGFVGVDFTTVDALDFCMSFENRCRLSYDEKAWETFDNDSSAPPYNGDLFAIMPYEE